MQKRLELMYDIKTAGLQQLREMQAIAEKLDKGIVTFTTAAKEHTASTRAMGESAAVTGLKYAALTAAVVTGAERMKQATVGTALYAARTQTLAIVTEQLAKTNNLNAAAVRQQVASVRDLGITTQEAYSAVNKMIFAQLDLKKATDLARLSQDAAVIAGINSSEALAGIVHGIVTRQPEVLRTYGITVTFEHEFAKASKALGRELSQTEKNTVAMNKVLSEGAKITGSYEAAMGTAGKQLTSMTRYVQEAQNAVGSQFIPALGRAVTTLTNTSKMVKENAELFSGLASTITAASLAAAAFKFTPGPLPLKLGVAGAVGLGTLVAGTEDPVKYMTEVARQQMDALRAESRLLQARRQEGLVAPDEFLTQSQALNNRQQLTRDMFFQSIMPYMERKIPAQAGPYQPGTKFFPKLEDIDLGGGIRITAGEIARGVMSRRGTGDPSGPLVNQTLIDAALREAEEQERKKEGDKFATKVRQATEHIEQLQANILEQQAQTPYQKYLREQDEAMRRYGHTPALRAQIGGVYGTLSQQALSDQLYETGTARRGLAAQGLLEQGLYGLGMPGVNQMVANAAIGKLPLTDDQKMFGEDFYKVRQFMAEVQAWQEDRQASQSRYVQQLGTEQAHRERMIELLSGPGGELQAANQVYQSRVDHAMRLYELSMKTAQDEHDLRIALLDAQYGREQLIATDRQRQMREYEQGLGRVFDAMLAGNGGGGIRTMGLGWLRGVQRQAFTNVGMMGFDLFRSSTRFQVPGQLNADGGLSTWGRIVRGTPLAIDPLKQGAETATVANTSATVSNTMALRGLEVAVRSGVGGAGLAGYASQVPAAVGGFYRGSSLPTPYGASTVSVGGYNPLNPVMGPADSLPTVGGYNPVTAQYTALAPRGPGTLTKAVGYAGAIATGAYGTYAGIKQGGLAGVATAGGALAGSTGAILAMAGLSGPLAPALIAVGLGLTALASAMPNPKERRGREISDTLSAGRYREPLILDNEFDLSGHNIDYNSRGQMRTYKVIIRPEININAFDAQSVWDRRGDITDAILGNLDEDPRLFDKIDRHFNR